MSTVFCHQSPYIESMLAESVPTDGAGSRLSSLPCHTTGWEGSSLVEFFRISPGYVSKLEKEPVLQVVL